MNVDLAEGQDAKLACEPLANPFQVLYYIVFARNRYIKLYVRP